MLPKMPDKASVKGKATVQAATAAVAANGGMTETARTASPWTNKRSLERKKSVQDEGINGRRGGGCSVVVKAARLSEIKVKYASTRGCSCW
jgi:hypothetical protein